jgi:large subunit ribosomal protein L29
MKPSEIRELTDEEILEKEEELERAVFNLRIQYATGQVEDTASLRNYRRDLARVKTILKERELKGPKK